MSSPTEKQIEAREAVDRLGSVTAAARELGINRSTVQQRLRGLAAHALRGHVAPLAPLPPEDVPDGFLIKSATTQYDADGFPKGHFVKVRAGSTDVEPIPEGLELVGISRNTDGNGNIVSNWDLYRKDKGAGKGLVDALQAAFAAYKGAAPLIPAPAESDEDLLTVYPLPDLHFGMYSYGRETGADYDTEIAGALARQTIGNLVARAEPSERCTILGLGDLFHADNQKNATPGSGHQLDVDGRWSRTFALGAKLMTDLVDIALQKHRVVRVVLLPGNHDIDSSICLRVALDLFYSANPRVEVYNEPGVVWAERFGKCLIGASHGHTMKFDRMAMVLATDYAKEWGETVHRAFFSGHVHTESAKEVGSVRLESLSSPAARDAWNAASGYRSGRALQAITYHKEHGEIGRNRVNIVAPSPVRIAA